MWGLVPQKRNEKFQKDIHITWQQTEILQAVEAAIQGKASKRISIRSGHGIGKSAVLAWLILWYLFSFPQAQVPCTAPTGDQMYDVLWKEIAKWLKKMPESIQQEYDWTTNYVRMRVSPETWFARARTARKEAPEALAGIHADYVMMAVDEASGVPEEIYNTAEGALTSDNILVILIGNPTRLVGYFHDTHYSDRDAWQNLHFNSEDSPIVDEKYVNRIIEKHGEDSDEYRIRVMGEFPKEDALDEKGYVPLLTQQDIRLISDSTFVGEKRLGVDPSGEGKDKTAFVVRDRFKAKIVGHEKLSTPKTIAQKVLTLMDYYKIEPHRVYIDNFGVGANIGIELMRAGKYCKCVNVGEKALEDLYLNLRAEAHWRMRDWLRKGGELITDERWRELLTLRYRRNLSDKIQIMDKLTMKKEGYASPDFSDSLMLTFVDLDWQQTSETIEVKDFDKHAVI